MQRRTYLAGLGGVVTMGLFTKQSTSYCSTPETAKVGGVTSASRESIVLETKNISIDEISWEMNSGRLLCQLSCSKQACVGTNKTEIDIPLAEHGVPPTQLVLFVVQFGNESQKMIGELVLLDDGEVVVSFSGLDS